MSDARQDEANGSDETDVAIDEDESVTPPAATAVPEPPVATPPSGTPLSKFAAAAPPPAAAAPPPAAGAAPAPNGVATPKPGSLTKVETPAKPQIAVTEPAPPDRSPEAAPVAPAAAVSNPPAVSGDGLHVVFAGMTSVGLVREHNEDNLVIADLATKARQQTGETIASSVSANGALFAVCDGMGGAAAGEVASQMAVDFLFEQMTAGEFGADRDKLARHLVSTVERAGKQIFDTAQADRSRRGMGTTSTVAVLLDKILFIAQVGDSRAYVLRNGVLKQVTKDQSLVNQLIEAGHLTEEEAEAFEHSNIILQALGTSEKVQVDLTFVELRQSDRLMMCSDGLSGLVHAETIADTLRTVGDPIACCTRLTELANEGGGHDNITVIVADFAGNALSAPQSGENSGYNQYPLLPEGAGASSGSANANDAAGSAAASAANGAQRGGIWQWWVMGLVAILLGVAISWWWENKQSQSLPEMTPEPTVEPEHSAVPSAAEAVPEPELVPTHISTDAEAGLLLIDGEPRGPLALAAPRDLDLAPGSYRVELQIEGSVAISQVITVESGKPLDLELKLPTGAIDAPEPEAEPAEAPVEPPARRIRPVAAEPVAPVPTTPTPAKAPRATTAPAATAPGAATATPTANPATPAPAKGPAKRDLPANPF